MLDPSDPCGLESYLLTREEQLRSWKTPAEFYYL